MKEKRRDTVEKDAEVARLERWLELIRERVKRIEHLDGGVIAGWCEAALRGERR